MFLGACGATWRPERFDAKSLTELITVDIFFADPSNNLNVCGDFKYLVNS